MKKDLMVINRIGFGMTLYVILNLSFWGNLLAQENRPTRNFMRQKLSYSQGILEGITLEKYDLIISNAMLLRNMNLTNAFLALKNPEYSQNITNFQAKVDYLIKAATEENLEKSTEAYSHVVNSCVACHKQFRRDQFVKEQSKITK